MACQNCRPPKERLVCCCGHSRSDHGGNPFNYRWRMKCLYEAAWKIRQTCFTAKCRCTRFKRCRRTHKHLKTKRQALRRSG